MITISSFLLRERLSSLLQSSIKNKTLWCQAPRISDSVKRFSSTNNEDPPADGTKDIEKENRILKYIQLELSILSEQGDRVPDPNSLQKRHWDELLNLSTKSARMKYYKYLFIYVKRKENEMIKRQEKKRAYLAFKEEQAQNPSEPKPHETKQNRFFLRIYGGTADSWRNNRLRQAMQFGDKLIFDCSYDQHMTKRETNATAEQLRISFAQNRLHKDPFDLHFCNADFTGETMKALEQRIPTVRNKEFPLNIHEGSYLDLFPKDKLVYLTPDCRNDLQEYDSDSIYIVGAMVCQGIDQPLSLMTAKKLGLKTARFPLDKYLLWKNGFKSLTLDQVVKVMLDLKTKRNWNPALRHIPKRKTINEDTPSGNANKFKKIFWKENIEFTAENNSYNNTVTTAEKFRKKNRNVSNEFESKTEKRKIDIKKLLSE